MASEAEMSFNKKMAQAKLILSSLFARKQNFMVVNGRRRNELIFTNIPLERALFYKQDIEDTLAVVKLTDKAAEILYELFPFFKASICIIEMATFLSTMNKILSVNKGVAPSIEYSAETEMLYFNAPPAKEEQTEQLFKDGEKMTFSPVVIGQMITEDQALKYNEILAKFNSFIKEPLEKEITIPAAMRDDRFVLNAIELEKNEGDPLLINLPVADGVSMVSYREYLTKRKAPWKYKLLVQFNDKQNVAKVAYTYRDDLVDVISIEPGTLWFPYRKLRTA